MARRMGPAVKVFLWGVLMASAAMETPKVLAFSDAVGSSAGASVAGDSDVGPLAKAQADSKDHGDDGVGDDSQHRDGGSSWRWDPRHNDSASWDDDPDEILPATCGYYARRKFGCGKPRTCRDCLDMDGCMVNQFGACVNMTKNGYEPAMDYHKAFEFNLVGSNATEANTTLRYHFPAINATYCNTTDETCIECKKTVFVGDVTDSRFCVGAGGCVCIASCEASSWEMLAGGVKCGPPPRPKAFAVEGPPPPKADTGSSSVSAVNWRDVWTMGGIPALVVVVGLLVVRSHRLETRRRDEAVRQQQETNGSGDEGSSGSSPDDAAPRPGRLNLPGWQALRRNLINKENDDKKENLLVDGAHVSPKARFVDMLSTNGHGVNPEVTVLAAPVMGAQVVEASAPPMSPQYHGEGVEPPSAPSFDSDFDFDQADVDMV